MIGLSTTTTGLCNQIFSLVAGILKAGPKTNVGTFSPGICSRERLRADKIFNLVDISKAVNKTLTPANTPGRCSFAWYDFHPDFIDTLKKIRFNDIFYELSNELANVDTTQPLNVIHLRIEPDAIRHWSKMNNLSEVVFTEKLHNIYRTVVKDIPPGEQILILTDSIKHPLIKEFSKTHHIITIDKSSCGQRLGFAGREISAIIDLLAGIKCNATFIGCHNLVKKRGSTFSFTLWILSECKKGIFIDLDDISQPLSTITK